MSHHSTAAGTKGTICQSSWKEGRHHIFIFSKEDETEKQAIKKNTSNTYITFHPWSQKNVVRICMDKKGFYLGEGREQGLYFQNQKVVSHSLINKTNYIKLSLSQKIRHMATNMCQ